MRCTEFLKSYSDYRDRLITDPVRQARLVAHTRFCERCARHDRALRLGVDLLRTEEMDLSHRARVRLRVRLALGARPVRSNPNRAVAAAAAMVVVAIAWGTLGTPQPIAPPRHAETPRPAAVARQARLRAVPTLAVPTGYLISDSRVPPRALLYQGSYEPVQYRDASAAEP